MPDQSVGHGESLVSEVRILYPLSGCGFLRQGALMMPQVREATAWSLPGPSISAPLLQLRHS